LKPGKLLLAQVGTLYWLEAGNRLKAAGLTDVAGFSIHFANPWQAYKLNSVKMRDTSRLLLVFSNGPYAAEHWVDTGIDGHGRSKEHDAHETNVDDLAYWIHRLTLPAGARGEGSPADLVASVCGGVFSEGVACRRLARRFLGCDPDAEKCASGRRRIAAVPGVHVGPVYSRWRG
jgi:hypothetical protein